MENKLKASWTIKFWKSGSGFSHEEIVEWSHDHNIYSSEDAKKAALDFWYGGQWGDDEYDGHQWKVEFYNEDDDPGFAEPVETVLFWVYPEDFD